jgi:hypothetical protein
MSDRTETRSDALNDYHDDYHGNNWDDDWEDAVVAGAVIAGTAAVVGTAVAVATAPRYVTTLPCTPVVIMAGGMSYYQCGSAWYTQTYVGGGVSYVVAGAPPGY